MIESHFPRYGRDDDLVEATRLDGRTRARITRPEVSVVVLGAGSRAEEEVNLDAAARTGYQSSGAVAAAARCSSIRGARSYRSPRPTFRSATSSRPSFCSVLIACNWLPTCCRDTARSTGFDDWFSWSMRLFIFPLTQLICLRRIRELTF